MESETNTQLPKKKKRRKKKKIPPTDNIDHTFVATPDLQSSVPPVSYGNTYENASFSAREEAPNQNNLETTENVDKKITGNAEKVDINKTIDAALSADRQMSDQMNDNFIKVGTINELRRPEKLKVINNRAIRPDNDMIYVQVCFCLFQHRVHSFTDGKWISS